MQVADVERRVDAVPAPSIALETRLRQLSSVVHERTRQLLATAGFDVYPFQQMIAYHLGWAGADLRALPKPLPAGKQLRPALCLLVAEAVCGQPERAVAPAVALELVHNFSLVHDDIQDGSPLRRHRPAVWSLWGIPQAVNVGDGLFTLAQLALLAPTLPQPEPQVAIRAAERLNGACLALVQGQFLDLEFQRADRITLDEYRRMVAGKTAALLQCACELGALYAEAASDTVAAFGAFGRQLGLAFQYQDDVLGAWGETAVTGKPGADDLRTKKKGLPAVLAFEALRGQDATRFDALYRGPGELSETQLAEVVAILERGAIRGAAECLVEEAYARALQLFERPALPDGPAVRLIAEFCRSLVHRRA